MFVFFFFNSIQFSSAEQILYNSTHVCREWRLLRGARPAPAPYEILANHIFFCWAHLFKIESIEFNMRVVTYGTYAIRRIYAMSSGVSTGITCNLFKITFITTKTIRVIVSLRLSETCQRHERQFVNDENRESFHSHRSSSLSECGSIIRLCSVQT